MYYDKKADKIIYAVDLERAGLPADFKILQKFEIYPLIEKRSAVEYIELKAPVKHKPTYDENLGYYVQEITYVDLTVLSLQANLPQIKQHASQKFLIAFAEIDARSPRSARGIVISLVDGTFPKETLLAENTSEGAAEKSIAQELTPEQQQRIIDVGIMWELEEVAQVNRDMQAELLALEITEDMTLEEAQEITLRVATAKPWLPWREAQKP